jgi:hypothetical protein
MRRWLKHSFDCFACPWILVEAGVVSFVTWDLILINLHQWRCIPDIVDMEFGFGRIYPRHLYGLFLNGNFF